MASRSFVAAARPVNGNENQTIRRGVRQGPEQHAVTDGEHTGRQAAAGSQRQDGCGKEHGSAAKRARRELEIANRAVEHPIV